MKYMFVVLLAALMLAQTNATDYVIVALAPVSGSNQIAAATFTQWTDILNARAGAITTSWANGHTLSVTIKDTQSSKFRALQHAADIVTDPLVLGVIHAGIPNWDIEELARFFRLYGVPSISVSTTDADSLDPVEDFFFSLHVEHEAVDVVLASLMEQYSWTRVALIYDADFWYINRITELSSSYEVHSYEFDSGTLFGPIFQMLISKSISVVAVLSSDADKVNRLMKEAQDVYGVFLEGFAWIPFGGPNPEAFNVSQGLIIPQYVPLPSANIAPFTSFLSGLPGGNTAISEASPRIYDAMTIFGDSILTALGQSGTRLNVRDAIAATNLPNGMSGSISFITKGFRGNAPYQIWNVHQDDSDESKNKLVSVFEWDGALVSSGSEVIFIGPTTAVPDSTVDIYTVCWLNQRAIYPLDGAQMTELVNFATDASNGFTNVSFPVPMMPAGTRLRVSVIDVGSGATTLIPIASVLSSYGVDGVIAQIGSGLTEVTENILSPYGMPVISDVATAPILSNKERYPTFLRNVAPDNVQGAAIISLCQSYGWTEVGVIHSSSTYGSGIAQVVSQEAFAAGITISASVSLDEGATSYAAQLSGFISSKPRIVLLLIDSKQITPIMNDFAAASFKAEAYVASDSVSYAMFSPSSYGVDPAVLSGYIATLPSGGFGSSFDSFSTVDIPALSETHGARRAYNTLSSSFVSLFLDTVFIYADSVARVKAAGGNAHNRTLLLNAMRSTDTLLLSGETRFDSNGDRVGSYDLINFLPGASQAVRRGRISPDGGVSIYEAIIWPSGTTEIPIAVLPRNVKWLDWKSPAGIIMAIFAGLGIVTSIIMFIVMVHQRESPVVMVATWQFLLVMLFGCALGFGSVFTWIGRPQEYTCALRIWVPPMAFILIMAPLLTKTWRLHRIFTLGSLKVKPFPLSYLIAMCSALFTVQLIICIFWVALGTIKPVIINDANDKTVAYAVCGSNQSNRIGSYVTYGYLGLLMLIGCYLTFRVRNLPKDFNESRWIGFSIFNTLLFSVIIIIVGYALSKFPVTVMILICVCTLAIATGAVAFMLAPKLWTLIRHPEKRSSSSGRSGSINTNTNNASMNSRKSYTGPRHDFSKGTSRENSKNESKRGDDEV